MKAVSAHVQNGQIVLDEPVELPEGAAVEVLPSGEELSPEDRSALDTALAESADEFARGDYEDARAFADKLVRGS